ncbi:MAG: hypothetical protein ACYC21_12220, partial [Eubacteriales bacterium]
VLYRNYFLANPPNPVINGHCASPQFFLNQTPSFLCQLYLIMAEVYIMVFKHDKSQINEKGVTYQQFNSLLINHALQKLLA